MTLKPVKLQVTQLEQGGYHVFVSVKVNDKRCRFLLDTGASKTVVDHGFFEKHFGKRNLKVLEQETTGLHSTQSKTSVGKIKVLSIGQLQIKNMLTAAVDLGHVNATYRKIKVKPIHGILGSDVLLHFKAVIDYGQSTMQFYL